MAHVEAEVETLKSQIRAYVEEDHRKLLGLDDIEGDQATLQDGLIRVPNSQLIVSN